METPPVEATESTVPESPGLSMTPAAIKMRALRAQGLYKSPTKGRAKRTTLACPYCTDAFLGPPGLAQHVKLAHPREWQGTLRDSVPSGYELPTMKFSPAVKAKMRQNLDKARKVRWARFRAGLPVGKGLKQTKDAIRKRRWAAKHRMLLDTPKARRARAYYYRKTGRAAPPLKKELSTNPMAVAARARYQREKAQRLLAAKNGAVAPAVAPAKVAAPAGRIVNYCPQCGWDLRGTLKAQLFIDSQRP